MVNRGSTKSQCVRTSHSERETIPSSKNKMQNNVLYKAAKNKIYANLVNVFLHSNQKDWGFNTLLVLTLDLCSWRGYIFQIRTNVQLNTLSLTKTIMETSH